MTQNVIQPSFAAGEISPKLYGRVDQALYRVACRRLQNMFVNPGGSVSNRAGTEFCAEVADSNKRGRLIPFQFNGRVTYILEFGDQVMRVIKDGGLVYSSGSLITNGTFDTNITGWADASTGGGSISWDSLAGGRMALTRPVGAITIARQSNNGYVIGNTYNVTIGVLGGGGQPVVNIGTTPGGTDVKSYPAPGGPGNFSFVAPATTLWFEFKLGPAAGSTTAYVDTISVTGSVGAGTVFTVATPYNYLDLPQLRYTQSADVLTLCHPNYPPQDLSRTGDAAWTLTPVSFAPSITRPTGITVTPTNAGSNTYRYKVTAVNADDTEESLSGLNNTSQTISGATQANPVVLTITATTLVNGDEIEIASVGGMTQLNGNRYIVANKATNTVELRNLDNTNLDGTTFTAYTSGGTATPTFGKTTAAALLSSTNTITVAWANQTGITNYNIYRETAGVFGYIGSSTSNSFVDTFIASDSGDTPPQGRNPFANANYPSCVAYHDQRKWFANSTTLPQTLWATQTGNFKNMNVSAPTKDDDAITRTLVARQVNAIQHMVSLNVLLLLTSGAEWKLWAGSNSDAITPTNCYTKPQSYNGCGNLAPLIANNSVLFVQEMGSIVRDIGYDFTSDTYTGTDRSVWSDHLFVGHSIQEWDYAQEPFRIIWCVRDDGVLLGFTYMKEQSVFGWHRHITDGAFESVAVIEENSQSVPYFIVRRTINGVTKRYIERMKSRQITTLTDSWFVDCGLQYNSSPTTTISGLGHLEGKTVSILGDGNVFPQQVVTGGKITLNNAASIITVGLPMTAALETLDLDVGEPTIQGKRKKVSAVTVKVADSRGVKVGGVYQDGTYSALTEVKERTTQPYGTPIGLMTGQERVIVDPLWATNGRMVVQQDYPLPTTITALVPEVDLGN